MNSKTSMNSQLTPRPGKLGNPDPRLWRRSKVSSRFRFRNLAVGHREATWRDARARGPVDPIFLPTRTWAAVLAHVPDSQSFPTRSKGTP
jgi:hypothetical protein